MEGRDAGCKSTIASRVVHVPGAAADDATRPGVK